MKGDCGNRTGEMRVMIATMMQSLPVTLLVEGGIFVTLAVGLRLSQRGSARAEEAADR